MVMASLADTTWTVTGLFHGSPPGTLEHYTIYIDSTGTSGSGHETGSELDRFSLSKFTRRGRCLTFQQVWPPTPPESAPTIVWQFELSGPSGRPAKMTGDWITGSGDGRRKLGEFTATRVDDYPRPRPAPPPFPVCTIAEAAVVPAEAAEWLKPCSNQCVPGSLVSRPAVIAPYSVAPSDTVPRLHVLPYGVTNTMTITAAVFSPANPVFRGGKRGLVIDDAWPSLSAYYENKAKGLGISTKPDWDLLTRITPPATGVIAPVPIQTAIGTVAHSRASVLGFLMPSPYYSVGNPDLAKAIPDDQLFHWASILNRKMGELQMEGTFCWQYVIANALEPELTQEFNNTDLSLTSGEKQYMPPDIIQFHRDLSELLQDLQKFTAHCQAVDKIAQASDCGGREELQKEVAARDKYVTDAMITRVNNLITEATKWQKKLQCRIGLISTNWSIVEAAARSQGIVVDALWKVPATVPPALIWNLTSDVSTECLRNLPGLATTNWSPALNALSSLTAIVQVLQFYKTALTDMDRLIKKRDRAVANIAAADKDIDDLTAEMWEVKNR